MLLLLYNNVQHSLQQSLNINLAVDSTADDFYLYVVWNRQIKVKYLWP